MTWYTCIGNMFYVNWEHVTNTSKCICHHIHLREYVTYRSLSSCASTSPLACLQNVFSIEWVLYMCIYESTITIAVISWHHGCLLVILRVMWSVKSTFHTLPQVMTSSVTSVSYYSVNLPPCYSVNLAPACSSVNFHFRPTIHFSYYVLDNDDSTVTIAVLSVTNKPLQF